MEERWLPIPGYEGSYEVSDLGRVRSIDRTIWNRGSRFVRGRLLAAHPSTFGHPRLYLSRDGRRKYFGVHQLVMLAFVGPRPDGMEVRHLNGDESDPRLCNLAYGTHRENMADMVAHGRSVLKDRCINGHEMSGENLWWYRGYRRCRSCKREHNRLSEERKRRAKGVTGKPKTHCAQGHLLAGDNLYETSSGHRGCKACRREFQRRYRAKLKARLREAS